MERKILLTSLFCLTSILSTNAQNVESEKKAIDRPKHEINIGFTNLFNPRNYPQSDNFPYEYITYDKSLVSNDLIYYPIEPYIPPAVQTHFGVGYKFHFGKNAARVRFGLRSSTDESKDDQSINYRTENDKKTNAFRLRAGYERTMLRLKRFDFYLGLDGIYSKAVDKNNTFSFSNTDASLSKEKMTYEEIGAGLSLGIRYFVHKNISFSAETTMDYTNLEIETKSEFINSGSFTYENEFSNTREITNLSINPISILSFNVHF